MKIKRPLYLLSTIIFVCCALLSISSFGFVCYFIAAIFSFLSSLQDAEKTKENEEKTNNEYENN